MRDKPKTTHSCMKQTSFLFRKNHLRLPHRGPICSGPAPEVLNTSTLTERVLNEGKGDQTGRTRWAWWTDLSQEWMVWQITSCVKRLSLWNKRDALALIGLSFSINLKPAGSLTPRRVLMPGSFIQRQKSEFGDCDRRVRCPGAHACGVAGVKTANVFSLKEGGKTPT